MAVKKYWTTSRCRRPSARIYPWLNYCRSQSWFTLWLGSDCTLCKFHSLSQLHSAQFGLYSCRTSAQYHSKRWQISGLRRIVIGSCTHLSFRYGSLQANLRVGPNYWLQLCCLLSFHQQLLTRTSMSYRFEQSHWQAAVLLISTF